MPSADIINNEANLRFEAHIESELAYLEYRFYKDDVALMHTFVPESLRGRGLAAELAHYALEWARHKKKKVMIYCPFVAKYVRQHPEYEDLIDSKYRAK